MSKTASFLFSLLLVTTAGALPAQPPAPGTLKGVITDESGALVPGAAVTATAADGQQKTATSGADGAYLLNGLKPGPYMIMVDVPGLRQTKPANVTLGSAPATLNIPLAVAASKQEITVQETVGPVIATDPSQNAAAIVMHGEDLAALADDPDDLQADLEALAGPAAGPSTGQIYIDGFSGGDAPLPSKEAIREIRVNQNPFSPEYDAIGFGRIEILTKPGADSFRGGAYYNYGNDALNSRNPFAAQKSPFSLKEYGGNLGGPLRKNASFFTDIDKRDIDNGGIINAITLDPATLSVVSPYTQVFSSPLRRLRSSSRLDYQLNPANTLIFRYTLTRDESRNAGIGNFSLASQGYHSLANENAFEATETAVLSPSVINETRFQFRHQNSQLAADSNDPAINVSSAFNGGGSAAGIHDYIHHHYQVQNYTTLSKGSHTVKFGVRLQAVDIQDTSRQNFNGSYTFGGAYAPVLDANNMPLVPGIVCHPNAPAEGCATISSIEQYRRTLLFQRRGLPAAQIRLLGGGATQFSINAGQPFVHAGGMDAGLFAGDDWRLRPNLTVSLGLRYETQDNIHTRGSWAPRLGFAWAPGGSSTSGSPKFVIRGGFGIFYDRFSEQSVLLAQRFNGQSQQQYVVLSPDTFPNVPSLAALQSFAKTQTVHTISSSIQPPYVLQSAIGLERQLPRHTTLAVNFINTHGLHELLSRNINAPRPGTYTGIPGSGIYPYGSAGPILEIESAGLYNQHQLTVNVNSQVSARVSLFGFYSLNRANSNTDGAGWSPANQYDLRAEYGPSSNDIHNRAVLGGSYTSFWGVRLNPFVSVQSGRPFNIVTSQDIYGDALLTARPGLAVNPSQPGVIDTPYGILDPNPGPGETILPRNFGRSPGQFNVNLRLSKTFGFGPERTPSSSQSTSPFTDYHRYKLTIAVSARNVLNYVNRGPIVGNINSPFFGESTQIAGGYGAFGGNSNNRRLELQARFNF